MRLGQLARKLSISTSEVVDFLAAQRITIEPGINTRLDDTLVAMVIEKFAPAMKNELLGSNTPEEITAESTTAEPAPPAEVETMTQPPAALVAQLEEEVPKETDEEKPEVIKAPKIELSGLKVLGKIELPEPKKKETKVDDSVVAEDTPATPGPAPVPERKRSNLNRRESRENRPQRPRANPIALQREREAEEAQRKKREEAKREKERKAQHYFNKVKPSAPTRKMKVITEQVEEMTDLVEQPKTWWGRFMRWLTT